jgi:hypothetical protein
MFPIFDKLGGLDAALDVIEKRRGKRLAYTTVWTWKDKGEVPAINRIALMDECRERRIRFRDADFLPTEPVRRQGARV